MKYIIIVLLLLLLIIFYLCNKREDFKCNIVPTNYDTAYAELNEPLLFNKYKFCSKNEDRTCRKSDVELASNIGYNVNSYYCSNNGLDFTCNDGVNNAYLTNMAKGDYLSAAPKRDIYYQPNMGRLGDDTMSGYPYYGAI